VKLVNDYPCPSPMPMEGDHSVIISCLHKIQVLHQLHHQDPEKSMNK